MDFQLGDLLLDVLLVAFGVVAILNGRRLYWVFVGIGGAIVGMWLSAWLIPARSEWLHIAIMLGLGVMGVWISYRFERIALHIAAFVLGGFIVQFLMIDSGLIESQTIGDAMAIIVGGILGVVFEIYYGERSLIVVSSFTGAALIAGVLDSGPAFDAALFSGLAAVGMLLQSREWIDLDGRTLDIARADPDGRVS